MCATEGVELDTSCQDAKFNLGLTLLTIGQLKEDGNFMKHVCICPTKLLLRFLISLFGMVL